MDWSKSCRSAWEYSKYSREVGLQGSNECSMWNTMQNFSAMEMRSNVWVSGPRPPFEWQGTQAARSGVWPTSIPVLLSVELSASALPALIPSCSTGGVNTELFPQERCVLMQTASSAFSHDAAEQRPSLPGERTPGHNCFQLNYSSPFLVFGFVCFFLNPLRE